MKKIFILLTILLLTLNANARKFYISTSGNDANNGTSITTPWLTMKRITTFGNSGQALAGDTFAFKCGDTFIAPDQVNGMRWYGGGWYGLNCPSGTSSKPIVFTSYGTGAKPNFIFPYPSTVVNRTVMSFTKISYIVVDGLQFNDTRFDSTNKITPGYTLGGILMGEWSNSGDSSTYFTNNSVVKNCDFNNISYPIVYNGNYNKIFNNTMKNLSNAVIDGIGSYGANGITMTGCYDTITNNTIKGAWAYSSYFGLNGGAIELFNVNNYNFIGYNTFIDCGGVGEFGAGKVNQTANYNTFAYNKIINCGDVSYANISGTFAIQAKNIRWWNNIIIENANSRFSGINFGTGFDGFITQPIPATKFFSNNGTPLADTVWDFRNNIFWISNKTSTKTYIINNGVKAIHLNNVYKLTNGAVPGFTLNGNELLTTNQIFVDTSNIDPALWDLHLITNIVGTDIGLKKDFENNNLNTPPSVGLYESNKISIPSCEFTYSQWTICNTSGYQNRDYIVNPIGCTGVPPLDSIQRTCNNGIVISVFYYNTSNRRIVIQCNVAGQMDISNTMGTITRIIPYLPGLRQLSVSTLPRGTYYAATYGRSLMFIIR